jgi:hypothetical protein
VPEQRLVNLRGHTVEVHLPDKVVVLGPWESVPITEAGGQVEELERQGLVERREQEQEEQEEQEAKPARRGRPRGARPRPGTR